LATEVAAAGHHAGVVEYARDVFLMVQPGKISASIELQLDSFRLSLTSPNKTV